MNRGAVVGVTLSVMCACSSFEAGRELEDFDAIWQEVAQRYTHLQTKQIDWIAVRDDLRPRLSGRVSAAESEKVLVELLASLKDPHVWFRGSKGRINPYLSKRWLNDADAFDLDIPISRLSTNARTAADGRITYGRMPNGLGYLYIRNFRDGVVDVGVGEALGYLFDSPGLVLDVRGNQGGSQAEITRVVGRFTADTFPGLPTFVLGEPIESPEVVSHGRGYFNPVAVRVDGRCFSAWESFAAMMGHLASVAIVGGVTAGGGGGFTPEQTGVIELPSGRQAGIPTAELRHYDHSPLEWFGVLPSILVPQSAADIADGNDPRLEAAMLDLQRRGNG